ncbi:ABC transporter substrate-binding protein [Candidatus Hydrogenedentota bacterium]
MHIHRFIFSGLLFFTLLFPAYASKHQVWMATTSSSFAPGFEILAEEYEKLHPEIDVKVQVLPFQNFGLWMDTRIQGGLDTAPDIHNGNHTWDYFEKGLVIDFAPYLDKINPYTGKPWRSLLSEAYLEKMKRAGGYAVVPYDFIEIAFFYNKDVFKELSLEVPDTWEALLEICEKIKQAGHIPVSIPANQVSYKAQAVAWLSRCFSDAFHRDLIPYVMAQPGDWEYGAKTNEGWKQDIVDPYDDFLITVSGERKIQLSLNGIKEPGRKDSIRYDSPRFREMYTKLKEFSRYWEPGFNGVDDKTAYQLFLTQKAVITLDHSGQISKLLKDMQELYPEDRFDWEIFKFPTMTSAKYCKASFRGVGGPGTMFSVVKKNSAQVARAVDFLMYTTTAHAAKILVDTAIEEELPLIGPMLIKGAEIPENIKERFAPFYDMGIEKTNIAAPLWDNELQWVWTVWAMEYFDDRISLDEFLDRYQKAVEDSLPRLIKAFGYDMDPTTKDMQ